MAEARFQSWVLLILKLIFSSKIWKKYSKLFQLNTSRMKNHTIFKKIPTKPVDAFLTSKKKITHRQIINRFEMFVGIRCDHVKSHMLVSSTARCRLVCL
jgi:hypothetical protein